MTIKTHTQKDGTIWEWEETPELISSLAEYWSIVNSSKING